MCAINEEADHAPRAALPPGGMIAVDVRDGKFYDHTALIDRLAGSHPYEQWLANVVELEPSSGPDPSRASTARSRNSSAASTPLASRWKMSS